MTTLIIV